MIAGPAPFTGETAKNSRETIAKVKLALAKANAGEQISDEKQLAALHKMAEQVSSKSSFGVQSDGFQLLRSYADKQNYKKNPCNDKKQVSLSNYSCLLVCFNLMENLTFDLSHILHLQVAWEHSTEFTDSQCRYVEARNMK